ncbi:MAG: alpha-hydroxy-acid oxidizing protein, partial [Pseudomonadales bacterium]
MITCIEDLKSAYQRSVPKMFYDYTESGSWSEYTFRENERALQRLQFRQRVLVDLRNRDI